jgi:thiol-disulfide isomerase/thioredoxin
MNLTLLTPALALGALGLPASGPAASPARPVSLQDETPDDEKKPKVLKLGVAVPEDFTLPDLDGKAHTFKDLRGKVVIVHFWSDRCPAERHADPVFKKMEERYAKSKDVVMIGIASNQNELGAKPAKDADTTKLYTNLRKKIATVGYTHDILIDHGNVASDFFQARSTPHCFVLDTKGRLQYAGALDDDPRGRKGDEATNYVNDAVDALLKDERPEVTTTKPYG